MNATEGLLHEIGLSEYEAKTLICLMTHGTSTAEEISRIARIPLPRVYDTIEKLIKMGFVLSTKTRPKRYKPVETKTALNHYMTHKHREFETNMSSMRDVCKKIVNDFSKLIPERKPPNVKDWRIWSTRLKPNIISMRSNFQKKAEREILVLSGDASFIREDFSNMKKIINKGINIRVLVHNPEKNQEFRNNIKKLKELGIEMKTGYDGTMRGNIIDNKILLIFLKWGKRLSGVPGTDKLSGYEMLITDNPTLIKTMREYFNFYWDRLQ